MERRHHRGAQACIDSSRLRWIFFLARRQEHRNPKSEAGAACAPPASCLAVAHSACPSKHRTTGHAHICLQSELALIIRNAGGQLLQSEPRRDSSLSIVIVSGADSEPLAEQLGLRCLKPEQLLSCAMAQRFEA